MNASFNSSNSTENATTEAPAGPDPLQIYVNVIAAWYTIFCILATVAFNSALLVVYCIQPDLRSPFNAYIANLAIAEILSALTAMPGDFIRGINWGDWPYNAVFCSVILYCQQIFGTAIRYGHLLITINRIWAVTFPLNYRTAHTTRVSSGLIVGVWVYLHVLSMTMLMRGRLLMGTAATDLACENNNGAHRTESILVEFIGFDLPEILILLSYPYILWKLRQSRLVTPAKKIGGTESTVPTALGTTNGPVNCSSGGNGKTEHLQLHVDHDSSILRRSSVNHTRRSSRRSTGNQVSRPKNRVLTYMVIGILVCWTPNHVFFLINDFTGDWNQIAYGIQYFLQYTYSWVSPFLIYSAMPQIRKAVNDLVHCRTV